jgi:hypothetical protein
MQELEALCHQFDGQNRHAGYVTAGAVEAVDEAPRNRVDANIEDDWNRRGCVLGSICRRGARRDDYSYLPANELGRQCRQSIVLATRPAIFDRDVLTLNVTGFLQPFRAGCQLPPAADIGRTSLCARSANSGHPGRCE